MNNLLSTKTLTQKKIFFFWLPLSVMWIIMGLEQPLINAFLARMPEAKENLAAFGVTFALCMIIESPVIQLLSAATTLVSGKQPYYRLLMFMHIMGIILIILHIIIGITPVYPFILKNIMGIPDSITEISRKAFLFVILWIPAIGYRRLWQGVLIRYGRTKVIPVTMTARLLVSTVILVAGYFTKAVNGAVLGGMCLSCGAVAGAVTSYIYVRPVIKSLKKEEQNREGTGQPELSWKNLLIFYYPLALTSFITLSSKPILTIGLARALYPMESLAVWPVITSLLFIFRSIALSFQEAVIVLLRTKNDYKELYRFVKNLAVTLSVIFLFVSITFIGKYWFKYVAGLSAELIIFTKVPLIIITLIPGVSVFISWYRGINLRRKKTGILARAVFLNTVCLVLIMAIGVFFISLSGVVVVSIALSGSLFVEALYLRINTRVDY